MNLTEGLENEESVFLDSSKFLGYIFSPSQVQRAEFMRGSYDRMPGGYMRSNVYRYAGILGEWAFGIYNLDTGNRYVKTVVPGIPDKYDFIRKTDGYKIDVKLTVYGADPDGGTKVNIAERQLQENHLPDLYVLGVYNRKSMTVWLGGWIEREEFIEMAEVIKAGDELNEFGYKATMDLRCMRLMFLRDIRLI